MQELTPPDTLRALQELDRLVQRWIEISPADGIRDAAERLLDRYSLRAADALQLAAALAWCNSQPKEKTFVGADGKLLDAAQREGFTVVLV
jgi:predicted nucleic acid-binding protein